MEIKVSRSEAGILSRAAIMAQQGQPFGEAQRMRRLSERIIGNMQAEAIRIEVNQARDVALSLTTDEIELLHHHLVNGTSWPFAQWPESAMIVFGRLIENMSAWLKDARAKDAFDALPESEKRKALAGAKKEQK